MSSKGGSNRNKRIALSHARTLLRKEHVWAIRPRPGSHSKETVIPLGEIIRDKLGLAGNQREIRLILNAGKVQVDEKVRKDSKFGVGLFDLVRIEDEKKLYRVVFDYKGRLQLLELDKKEKPVKICKVVRKKVSKKGLFQLTAHDGRTFMEKKPEIKVGDSLLIEVPSQKIVQVFPLKENQAGYCMSGRHIGTVGKIVQLTLGTMQKEALARMENPKEEFQTLVKSIVVVGKEKPAFAVEWNKEEARD